MLNQLNTTKELEKALKDTLENTNWRLLSNSISYRLGILTGRLKGYETEEDILKLAGKTDTKPKASTLDDEKRRKYECNNIVQLAKLTGKWHGIENMRKRRLTREPEGFYLEKTEGPIQCSICGESHEGNVMWWNLEGQRCPDCWRNIKECVIPSLKPKYDDKCDWFFDSQLR